MQSRKPALILLLMQPIAMPLMAASVQGSVIDAVTGAPIPRAHITLRGQADGKQVEYSATSETSGSFSFTGIPAGQYEALGDRIGYVNRSEAPEGRVAISVQANDSATSLTLKLTPTGSLTGRVTGSDGKPVEGESVSATGSLSHGAGITDETGHFRIGALPPGKYKVQAHSDFSSPDKPEIRTDGTVEVHDASTWWPGVLAEAQAGSIEVKAGTETPGADIKLMRVPFIRVSGRIVGVPEGSRAELIVRQGDLGMGQPVEENDKFELWRLDPGSYTLSAQWEKANGMPVGTTSLLIKVGGSNIDGIELSVGFSGIPSYMKLEDNDAKKPPGQ